MSENNTGPHLPPPAFPPGIRRHTRDATDGLGPEQAVGHTRPVPRSEGVPLISPDEPLPPRSERTHDSVDGALISPDEPLPRRPTGSTVAFGSFGDGFSESMDGGEGARADAGMNGTVAGPGEEGIATGLNDDPHLHAPRVVTPPDPHLASLRESLTGLTDGLKARGEAALRTTPQMSAFETTLRAYCAGYLAARRDEGRS